MSHDHQVLRVGAEPSLAFSGAVDGPARGGRVQVALRRAGDPMPTLGMRVCTAQDGRSYGSGEVTEFCGSNGGLRVCFGARWRLRGDVNSAAVPDIRLERGDRGRGRRELQPEAGETVCDGAGSFVHLGSDSRAQYGPVNLAVTRQRGQVAMMRAMRGRAKRR